jgi:glutathione S-transferase
LKVSLSRRRSRGETPPVILIIEINCTNECRMKGLGGPDEAKVAEYAAQLDGALAVYEGILAKQAYLAGNEVTLADLFHLPYGTFLKKLGYSEAFDKYPHVSKWFAGLEARESWKKVAALAAAH